MSNTKAIRIEATVPFDWSMRLGEDAGLFCALLVGPHALDVDHTSLGYEPNEHGGQTAMYELVITGTEAVSVQALQHVVVALMKVGGRNVLCSFTDLDDGNVYAEIDEGDVR